MKPASGPWILRRPGALRHQFHSVEVSRTDSCATWSIGNRTITSSSAVVRNPSVVAGRDLPGPRCPPAPSRSATTGTVGGRGIAHLLGRPRSAIIAKIRKGQIPQPEDATVPRRRHRPADTLSPKPLPCVRCTETSVWARDATQALLVAGSAGDGVLATGVDTKCFGSGPGLCGSGGSGAHEFAGVP